VFGDKNLHPDIESAYRIGKTRELSEVPQSNLQYEIFKTSMNSKI